MGGRGSSFGVEIISAVSPYGSQDAEIQELNVAGMTPMDREAGLPTQKRRWTIWREKNYRRQRNRCKCWMTTGT